MNLLVDGKLEQHFQWKVCDMPVPLHDAKVIAEFRGTTPPFELLARREDIFEITDADNGEFKLMLNDAMFDGSGDTVSLMVGVDVPGSGYNPICKRILTRP